MGSNGKSTDVLLFVRYESYHYSSLKQRSNPPAETAAADQQQTSSTPAADQKQTGSRPPTPHPLPYSMKYRAHPNAIAKAQKDSASTLAFMT